MKTVGALILTSLVFLATATLTSVSAQAQRSPQPATQAHDLLDLPQPSVVCTGWHALCTASTDCHISGDKANCECWMVNETHIVETAAIQDVAVKHLTQAKCTIKHPCNVDSAPVCKAIKYGQYTVDDVKYDWVSTYSYRGWCGLLQTKLKACVPRAPGYSGDREWAVCDAAPCTKIQNPSNPDRPLTCQCGIEKTSFVGTNGSCTGDNGGIMSSMPLWVWDFRNNTYRISMPGYEYVQGACAPLESDLLKEPRGDSGPW